MGEVTVREVEETIERWAPPDSALPGDPVGHQVGDREQRVRAVAVALDAGPSAVEWAASKGCELLVSHHPLIFRPMSRVDTSEPVGRAVALLCQHSISHYAAHTNWDLAPGGVNDALAEALGLENLEPFADQGVRAFIKVITFVPTAALHSVLDALADAGAGHIGLYRRCAFFHSGTGTFEPLPGAHPAIGEVGAREEVEEYRLEMVAPEADERELVRALRQAHPYEEPAFDIVPLRSGPSMHIGRIGELPSPLSSEGFLDHVNTALRCNARWLGASKGKVKHVAVVAGSGGDFVSQAVQAGAEVLVTGEIRHHKIVEARECGLGIVDATHEATEQPGVEELARRLEDHFGERLRVLCWRSSA